MARVPVLHLGRGRRRRRAAWPRPPGGGARRRGSSARAPGVTFALASAARYARRGYRGTGRGSTPRSACDDRRPDRRAAPRRARRAGTPPRTRRRGRRSRASSPRGRSPAASSSRAGRSSRPAGSRRRRATGRAARRRAPARRRASGRASRARCTRRSACPGRCPDGLNAAQPHDQIVGMCSSPATCVRGERLPLDDVEPLPERLQPLAPAGAGVELNCSIIPSRLVGIPIWIRSSMRVRITPRRRRLPRTAPCFDDRRAAEVDLGDEVGDLRRLPPPVVGRLVVRVRPLREQQERPRAALGEALHEREHVRAVLRGRRRPRRRQVARRRARSPRSAGGRSPTTRRRCRTACPRAPRRRRVGGLRRRADAVVEIEVEVDGLRALRAQLRRDDEVRRGADDPGPREDRRPERHHPVGVVDPERLLPAAGRTGAGRGASARARAPTPARAAQRRERQDPPHGGPL